MFINTTIDTTIDTTHPDPAHIRASTERLMALRNAALKDTTPKKRRARARKYPASQTPGDEETNTNKTEADANAILSLSKQLNMTGAETAAILTAGNKLMALKSAGREATFEALGDEAPTAEIKKLLALKGNVDDITAALKTPGEGKTSNKTKEVSTYLLYFLFFFLFNFLFDTKSRSFGRIALYFLIISHIFCTVGNPLLGLSISNGRKCSPCF